MFFIFLALLWLLPHPLLAHFKHPNLSQCLDALTQTQPGHLPSITSPPPHQFHFLIPNEAYLEPLQTLLAQQANPGAYLSVGSERGFIGAILHGKTSQLLLVDNNPLIVYFNRLNTLLLKVANHREDYVYLRLQAPWPEWQQRKPLLPPEDQALLTEDAWMWWAEYIRNHHHWRPFYEPQGHDFSRGHYLMDDASFAYIHRLAKSNQIHAFLVNLSSQTDLEQLLNFLNAHHIDLAVVDTSNVWEVIGIEDTVQMLLRLQTHIKEQSLFVFTAQNAAYQDGRDFWLLRSLPIQPRTTVSDVYIYLRHLAQPSPTLQPSPLFRRLPEPY